MKIAGPIGATLFVLMLISWIFFIAFSQITVRKLRKNLDTKESLGFEFASGFDVINVAQALAIPKRITDRFSNSALFWLHADSQLVRRHTNGFDKIFAVVFYWTFMITGLGVGITSILMAFDIIYI